MLGNVSFRKVFHALERAINITQQRNTYIISNISNLDTPHYMPKDIDFKTTIARVLESNQRPALTRTHSGHMDEGNTSASHIEPFEDSKEWNGYNWVNIDREMIKMSENNLMHRTAVEILLRKIATLKEVIKEGGR